MAKNKFGMPPCGRGVGDCGLHRVVLEQQHSAARDGSSRIQISPAAAGSCQIDAVKMCEAEGGSAPPASSQPAMASSYGPPNAPESLEFQIPAGQAIKLMCYYDPQHSSVYRADATPDAALTQNSVEYMKKQGFCSNK